MGLGRWPEWRVRRTGARRCDRNSGSGSRSQADGRSGRGRRGYLPARSAWGNQTGDLASETTLSLIGLDEGSVYRVGEKPLDPGFLTGGNDVVCELGDLAGRVDRRDPGHTGQPDGEPVLAARRRRGNVAGHPELTDDRQRLVAATQTDLRGTEVVEGRDLSGLLGLGRTNDKIARPDRVNPVCAHHIIMGVEIVPANNPRRSAMATFSNILTRWNTGLTGRQNVKNRCGTGLSDRAGSLRSGCSTGRRS